MIRNILTTVVLAALLMSCSSKEDRAEKFFERGVTFYDQEDMPKAKIEFQNAVQNKPNMADAYLYLSKIFEYEKDLPKYYENLYLADKFKPRDVDLKKQLIEIYLLTNEYEEALVRVNELKAIDPTNENIISMRSAALIGLGQGEKAKELLEKALKANPEDVAVLSLLAASESLDGNSQKALDLLNKAISLAPADKKNKYINLRLGVAQRMGDKDLIEKSLAELIQYDPADERVTLMLSNLYSATGRQSEAENLLDAFVKNNPDKTQAKLLYVETLSRRDVANGAQLLDQYINEEPSNTSLLFYKVRQKLKQNSIDEAIELLTQVSTNPNIESKAQLNAKSLLAEIYLSQDKTDQALDIVNKNLAADPAHEASRIVLVKQHLGASRFNEAISELRTVLRTSPNSESALILLGKAQAANGSELLADDAYRQVLDANPYNVDAAIPVVRRMLSSGDVERADQIVTKVITRNPNEQRLRMLLAQIKVMKRDWSGSKSLVEGLKGKGESSAYLEYLSGRIFQGQGQYERAVEKYLSSIKKQNDFSPALQALAASYLQLGKGEAFIEFINQYQSENKDNILSYSIASMVHRDMGDQQKAIAQLEKGLSVDSTWEDGYINLARMHVVMGNHDKAIETYKKARAAIKNSVRIELLLAILYEQKGRYEEAAATYEQLLQDNPKNYPALNNYLLILVDKIPTPENLETAKQLVPGLNGLEQPGFLDTAGWVKAKTGDLNGAEVDLRNAAEAASKIAEIQYHFGYVLKQLKREVEAKQVFKRAKKLENIPPEILALIDKELNSID